MALGTLSDLKSEMRDWALDRPDLIGKFQDCIDMATNDLNKVLRTRKQYAEVELVPDDEGVVPLPDDYLEWRAVTALSNPVTVLKPVTPEGVADIYPNAYGGWPAHFLVEDSTLTVMPKTTTPIQLKYWKRIPHLTEAEPTNWLLLENANLYLFGAMKYVETYKRNMAGVQMFGTLYSGLVDGMVIESKKAQWSRSRSRVAGRSTP
jgi:hypothetical protein